MFSQALIVDTAEFAEQNTSDAVLSIMSSGMGEEGHRHV
jgi:hypothetical protein